MIATLPIQIHITRHSGLRRRMLRVIVFSLLAGASSALRADPATALFAGGQLSFARSELDEARRALLTNDYTLARRLAAQASLDARLAWGMTDSAFVRRDALGVARKATQLGAQGVVSAGILGAP